MLKYIATIFYSNHGGTEGNNENNVNLGIQELIMAMKI